MKFQAHRENSVEFSVPQRQASLVEVTEYNPKTPLTDKVFAVFALIVTFPLLFALGLCIFISGQSPIFIQERIGRDCKPFRIFKFRTIPSSGWDATERAAKDSFLARQQLSLFQKVSKVLRATGLDELPQFANILKGDMQIIGPRPLMEEDFYALPEGREVRCVVLPGITGLAQINGGQDLDPESKLALDLYVIDHLSFRITAKIVMRTALRILGFTSATASISPDDLSRARQHMSQRMRRASIAMPLMTANLTHAPARAQHEWLTEPNGALRPIRFSSSSSTMTSSSEVSTKLKGRMPTVVESH